MNTVLETLASNVAAATVLALVVAVLAWKLRRPALLHCLWILVLLKLVTPPVFRLGVVPEPVRRTATVVETNVAQLGAASGSIARVPALASGLSRAMSLASSVAGTETPGAAPASTGIHASGPPSDSEEPYPSRSVAPGEKRPRLISSSDPPSRSEESANPRTPLASKKRPRLLSLTAQPEGPAGEGTAWWWWGLLAVAVGGALVVGGTAAVRVIRFQRMLASARPAEASLAARAVRLARKMGLVRGPRVWLVQARVSPLLWAVLGRPRLVLPAPLIERLSGPELDSLIVHELAHVRRRDHWVRWLELVVTALFWWLPLVWLVRRALRSVEEQCCDAWVVWSLPDHAAAYARALLHTVEYLAGERTVVPPAASGVGRVQELERRLTMIMERMPPRAMGLASRMAVAVTAVFLLSFLPTWAQSSPEDEIREVKRKLARVERAMDELRGAGLEREVKHLEGVAERMQAALERMTREDVPRGPGELARREAHEAHLAELKEKIAYLKREGQMEEARALYEELKAQIEHGRQEPREAEGPFSSEALEDQHRRMREFHEERARGAREHQEKIHQMERELRELKAHCGRLRAEGREDEAARVNREMERMERDCERARLALAAWERDTHAELQRSLHAFIARHDGHEGEPASPQDIRQALLRNRREFEEQKRKADEIRQHVEACEREGRAEEAEAHRVRLHELTLHVETLRQRLEEAERARAMDAFHEQMRSARPEQEESAILDRLRRQQQEIERHQKIIGVLEAALARTTRRHQELMIELERVKKFLEAHRLPGDPHQERPADPRPPREEPREGFERKIHELEIKLVILEQQKQNIEHALARHPESVKRARLEAERAKNQAQLEQIRRELEQVRAERIRENAGRKIEEARAAGPVEPAHRPLVPAVPAESSKPAKPEKPRRRHM